MNENRQERDKLREIDFGAAFPETPEAVRDAVRLAGVRIRRREEALRRRRLALTVVAAAVALAVGIGLAARMPAAPRDEVAAPKVSVAPAHEDMDTVYASKDDPCYHWRADCPKARGHVVALPLMTARAFEKRACAVCGGGESLGNRQ